MKQWPLLPMYSNTTTTASFKIHHTGFLLPTNVERVQQPGRMLPAHIHIDGGIQQRGDINVFLFDAGPRPLRRIGSTLQETLRRKTVKHITWDVPRWAASHFLVSSVDRYPHISCRWRGHISACVAAVAVWSWRNGIKGREIAEPALTTFCRWIEEMLQGRAEAWEFVCSFRICLHAVIKKNHCIGFTFHELINLS